MKKLFSMKPIAKLKENEQHLAYHKKGKKRQTKKNCKK